MAALVLGIAGQLLGPSLFGATAFTAFGTAVSGAQLGGAIGAFAGGIADQALLGRQSPQRLSDLNLTTSTEGAPVTRIDGTIRVGGQLIWATKFKQTSGTTGGKGALLGGQTTYSYSISFAIGLCEGVVDKLGRIWADGNLIDPTNADYGPPTIRFYQGSETQTEDPFIQEIEGEGNTPAYRGLCYVVFEDLLLTQFGNRIPQLQFELIRAITADRNPDALENVIAGVNLIPGAGEFVYATTMVDQYDGNGVSKPLNFVNTSGEADAQLALDDLAAVAPNLKSVSLVVGWFGSDLRAGNCTIQPKVEIASRDTYGVYVASDGVTKKTDYGWSVNGISRGSAAVVSYIGLFPAYGGTPCDESVKQIIAAIKAKGWKITFYPFLFMDIPPGNTLPNPYSNNAATVGQPVYPWRGRITCSPAAGYAGTVDKTSAAATQVNAFFTGAQGYNAMVLTYANLCVAAGGVDSFIIGSELRGLTQARSNQTTYPAVAALKSLAASVKAIVGLGCKVGYAADWSEWNNHQTGDAPGAVLFNLDPLWSDANVDFIGVDNYLPLSDWRDGTTHLDYNPAGPTSPHDETYLASNIQGGEDYAWYYGSPADRDAQNRTPITDSTYNKPWVWRAKDFWNWWNNSHYDRPSGTENASPTAWVPQSKPIRFTELGCPAVDKGANQPNVFYDPKSSESALPYYSNGSRDDLMQRAFLETHYNYWTVAANNPISSVYGEPMVDTTTISAWCWDARPYPFFPGRTDLWQDAPNYTIGDWLNGRLGAVLLSDLVAEICEQSGFSAYDVSDLSGLVTGYARTSTMSARDELSSLATAFFFDAVESQGTVAFLMRGRPSTTALDEDDLVIDLSGEPNFGFQLTRSQDFDLPLVYRITFIDASNGYEQGSYRAKRLIGNSNRIEDTQIPLVMDRTQAGGIGDRLIQEAWLERDGAAFKLPPSFLALDPCDEVMATLGGRARRMRIKEIADSEGRALTTVATDPSLYDAISGAARTVSETSLNVSTGRALLVFLDMRTLADGDTDWNPHVAAYADPWPGQVLLYKSLTGANYQLDTAIATLATIGATTADFYSGPTWRWDNVNSLYVQLVNGALSSTDADGVFSGENALAVQNQDGYWEILQFQTATLTGSNTYQLTGLLRGRLGSEEQMRNPVPAGARVVLLDQNVVQTSLTQAQARQSFSWTWGPRDKDISDPAYQSATQQFQCVGLMPLSPVHVGFQWDSSGDLTISWMRRDRALAAANLLQNDAPMSEQSLSFDVDILNGASVVRSFSALPQESCLYTAAQQAADFPSGLPNPLVVNVYQNSAVVGRGWSKTAQLYTR
jgi:hypothetical protein